MKKVIAAALALTLIVMMFAGCNMFGQQQFEISSKELSLVVGDSKVLSVIPESANKKLSWATSDSSVATVDNGTVRAKAVGNAVITVTSESGQSSSCNVTVTGKEVQSITLNNQTTTVEVGKSVQLKATVSPSDAANAKLTWSSSNGAVAVVNSDGNVTGAGEGVANIICKSENGVEVSCTVTVKDTKKQSSSSSQSSQQSSKQSSQSAQQGGYTWIYGGHVNPAYVYVESDFVFPESSIRQLTKSEISAKLSNMVGTPVSNSFAQDAINEIYARNGYVFKTASIRAYYESKPWYYADPTFTINDFNSYESYNIKLLDSYS